MSIEEYNMRHQKWLTSAPELDTMMTNDEYDDVRKNWLYALERPSNSPKVQINLSRPETRSSNTEKMIPPRSERRGTEGRRSRSRSARQRRSKSRPKKLQPEDDSRGSRQTTGEQNQIAAAIGGSRHVHFSGSVLDDSIEPFIYEDYDKWPGTFLYRCQADAKICHETGGNLRSLPPPPPPPRKPADKMQRSKSHPRPRQILPLPQSNNTPNIAVASRISPTGQCTRHSYIQLRRYDEPTRVWKKFLDSCPVCDAMEK